MLWSGSMRAKEGTLLNLFMPSLTLGEGATSFHTFCLEKVNAPPRVKIFMWLLSHNKLKTKDNLLKRGIEKPKECLFCSEEKTICHLFFGCVVAKLLCTCVANFCNPDTTCYLDLATRWLDNKKYILINTISTEVLWCIWLTRNDLVFHKQ